MTDSFRPSVLRAKAWDTLRDQWGQAALISLILYVANVVVMLLSSLVPFVGFVVAIFAVSVLAIGYQFIFLDVYQGKPLDGKTVLEPLHNYGRYLGGYVLFCVYVFLWSLLFYIPGIIKLLSYSMTFYIMRDNPEMSGEQAIRRSMEMMDGYKMDLFWLLLSFIGWILLCVVTLGIGSLWVRPYISTTMAAFYEYVKKENEFMYKVTSSENGDSTVVITTEA